MISFKQYYIEESVSNKTAVMTYGRMNPPTIGHAKLIDHVLSQPGDHHVFVSHTQDDKKNPLSGPEKVHYLQKMYPHHKEIFDHSTPEHPSIIHMAKKLNAKGYKHLHVVVGGDRVDEMHKLIHKYNGKEYNFKSIKVTSAGDRDPDAEGTEGMSASKMRKHAMEGNATEFAKGLHPALKSHANEMINKIKSRLK